MTTLTQTDAPGAAQTTIHAVRGGGGLSLHVREWGNPTGTPILFLHGWSQSHLAWRRQYDSDLADDFRLVACDLRGHGMSETPADAEHYTQGQRWADDVAAILGELDLDRPVLVGWSYGAFVIGDYVRAYGQDRIRAVNFVAGAVKLGETAFGTLIGPGFLDHFADATSDDIPTSIRGMRGLVGAFAASPLPAADERDPALLQHDRPGRGPCPPRRAPARLRRRPPHPPGSPLGQPGTRRHHRPARHGRAHRQHLPHRRDLLVRAHRARPTPRAPRPLQPRARRAGRSQYVISATDLFTSKAFSRRPPKSPCCALPPDALSTAGPRSSEGTVRGVQTCRRWADHLKTDARGGALFRGDLLLRGARIPPHEPRRCVSSIEDLVAVGAGSFPASTT